MRLKLFWLTALAAGHVQAHHSHVVEYNEDQPASVIGVIDQVQLANPHASLQIKTSAGVICEVSLDAPAKLLRTVRPSLLQKDQKVHVSGYFHRDNNTCRVWGTQIDGEMPYRVTLK